MSALHQLAGPMHNETIFTNFENLSKNGTSALIAGGGFVAVLLVIIYAIKKQTMGAVLSAGAMAVLFIYLLNNVSDSGIQQKVKDTVNNKGLGPVVHVEPARAAGGISYPTT